MPVKMKNAATNTADPGPHDLATAKEACAFLKISRTKLWRMMKKNPPQIQTVKIGDHIRVPWSVLQKMSKPPA